MTTTRAGYVYVRTQSGDLAEIGELSDIDVRADDTTREIVEVEYDSGHRQWLPREDVVLHEQAERERVLEAANVECPYDNTDCPAPGQPVGYGHHKVCYKAERDRNLAAREIERELIARHLADGSEGFGYWPGEDSRPRRHN